LVLSAVCSRCRPSAHSTTWSLFETPPPSGSSPRKSSSSSRKGLEHGGVLTSTLLAYVDSNLNVQAMSQRLYIHSNTAHYRLHRIADQTGLDLRKLGDVVELVVAIRLAQPRGDRPPGAWG